MISKQRLYSNMFLRNMFADLVGRSAYTKDPGGFVPYFQYKIEKPLRDYFLYFTEEPYALRYKNEVFNKLCTFSGADIPNFLDFHYAVYPDKEAFLRFLDFEIAERLKYKLNGGRGNKLESGLKWVNEKREGLRELNRENCRLEAGQPKPYESESIPPGINPVPQKLGATVTEWLDDVEERMEVFKSSIPAGNIQLNNHNHREKLIQLLYLVQTIQSPSRVGIGEQLFKKFTNQDLASILNLHFEGFTGKKLNTVEKNIRESRDLLRLDSPKVKKLEAALQDFFY